MDGDIIVWNNDDSSPHTVTERNGSTRSGNRSDDESDSQILEKIIDEIITNIPINIRNNLGGGGDDDDDNSSSQGSSSSAAFDSGIMQSGQTFSYTFDSSGTFEYYCAVHPSMVAEIVVS
ncbi:MAG: plastocyanin/azurin family copper-binding protein [Thermoproteota archaeon]|nr:plastocyanin/azurin family copper-binding protein [Thermoproteota archaeon]